MWRKQTNVTAFVLTVLLAASSVSGATFDVERVFGPEIPGQYKHPASIEQLASGDLYIVYYSGAGEYKGDTAVYGSRLVKGTTKWTPPQVIADTPFRSEGNAVMFQAPSGEVWLFYVCRYGETWSTSRIKAKVSRDGARTWSDSMMIAMQEGMMVRNRPIVLSNGDYLLPIYHEKGDDREEVGPESVSLFLRYNIKTHRWTPTGPIRSAKGNVQPAVVQVAPNHLVAYCRRGGGYGPTTDGWLIRAESRDGGQTWSEGKNSKFRNPNAAVELLKLHSGRLLLIYNDSMTDRTPLAAALSSNGDRTYAHRCNLVTGPGPYAYPAAVQAKDGKIHLVYTTEDRTVIMHATFDEQYIIERAGKEK